MMLSGDVGDAAMSVELSPEVAVPVGVVAGSVPWLSHMPACPGTGTGHVSAVKLMSDPGVEDRESVRSSKGAAVSFEQALGTHEAGVPKGEKEGLGRSESSR
jgi:hypothetical protein